MSFELSNLNLVRLENYIGGDWRAGTGSQSLTVTNPANQRLITDMPAASVADAERAIASAKEAFAPWRAILAKERGGVLQRWAALMLANIDDLARIMTYEQGKPLAEAKAEVEYAAGFLSCFAGQAERIEGEILQPHKAHRRMLVTREPLGVVAAITPWNCPSAMIARKAGAALAAGCTMVVLPSAKTPLSGLALARLAEEAGTPGGVFNVVVGDGALIGGVLAKSSHIRGLSFTGSTEVGRLLLRDCANTVKKISMELGDTRRISCSRTANPPVPSTMRSRRNSPPPGRMPRRQPYSGSAEHL